MNAIRCKVMNCSNDVEYEAIKENEQPYKKADVEPILSVEKYLNEAT